MQSTRTIKRCLALVTGVLTVAAGCAPAAVTDGQTFTGFIAKPTTIMVSHLDFSPEIVIQDQGLVTRLTRDMKGKPAAEIRAEAAQRVSNVIAETTIATLRDAGLKASPGSTDIALGDEPTLVITGTVRGAETAKPDAAKPTAEKPGKPAKRRSVGFGGTKSQAVADVQLTHLSWGGRKNVLNFTTASATGQKALSDEKFPPRGTGEKLSPDVERMAQRLGKDVANKVIAFAAQQGWITGPGALTAAEEKPRT